ncbi:MAG: hypothetical protein JST44_12560 [Cyanobacteria bacterium SZAS LIN-5]|nr:hypothetical protein [Cyanobacteria bacterium SZAS LIN-5]RTL37969.1 MAG: hypothetical protein EKK48_21960 [Candidatus Melainabacteria bacterium]
MTQKSSTLGDQYLYISPSGLKCVNPKAGFAMVTKAPDWNIVMFNDKTRCYYQTTLDSYKRTLAQRGLTSDLANRQWARGQSNTIAGMRATQFVMRGGGPITRMGSNGKPKTSTVSAADYWVSDEITVPARLGDLLASAYGLPTTQYVPLRLEYTDAKGPKRMLETYRMQATPIPPTYFQCPGGYKLVQSDAEVMMNDEQKQMIEDMSREMGGGLESPSPSPQQQYSPQPTAAPAARPAQQPAAAGGGTDALSKLLDAYKKTQHK